ncbi:MAG TPA: hydroxymethylbilane synthase [Nocardioidaceae bacterium]|nr:hydroxymethylbilane synthase [Nocardioidaceae bacterium]
MTTLRLGSRASALARAQAQLVADRLAGALGAEVRIVDIRTRGDRDRSPLADIGGQGVFVGAVRGSLAAGQVDIAVHSLKDLPTEGDDRVVLAAVPERADPRDALVAARGRTLATLDPGARVGTGSARRAAQLLAARPDLSVVPVRGNVDTRLALVERGEVGAVVLAMAGLLRLGREDAVTDLLDPSTMLPAPGQGALAVEVAAANVELAGEVAAVLDEPATRLAVTAERELLAALGVGCSAPVGALGTLHGPLERRRLRLEALRAEPDGTLVVRKSAEGWPGEGVALAHRLADLLCADAAVGVRGESLR